MDDTPEILDRLDRISALAASGAARSELLREVRSLLEEGERSLRVMKPDPGGVSRSSSNRAGSAGSSGESSHPRREAGVS